MVVGPQIHIESTLPRDLRIPEINWLQAQETLQSILVAHEESPSQGSRFLISTKEEEYDSGCPCLPIVVHIEYIIVCEEGRWSYHVAAWSTNSPYPYHFDVSEMRPFVTL